MKNYILKLSVLFGVTLLVGILAYKFDLRTSSNVTTTKPQAKRITLLVYTGQNLLNEFNKTTIDNYPTAAGTFDLATMASQITTQLTQAFSNTAERPLPLVANWNVGIPEYSNGLDPMYMINRLSNGEHIVPTWKLDPYFNDTIGLSYYEESIKKAAELGLPLVFILPSPESALTKDDVYFSMDRSNNPNVITPDGIVLPKLSPFGPNNLWNEVGGQWSTTSLMAQLQEWYPNPPLVLFIDEDKSAKLLWSDLNSSSRYQTQYPLDATDEFKRTLVNAQWVEKYRQLHKGFRDGFTNNNWKQNSKFISRNELAYNMGRTSDWQKNATTTNLHANIWPLTADGLTVNYQLGYDDNDIYYDPRHTINNLPFMLDKAKEINHNFAFQLNIDAKSKIDIPERYRGFTQYALWFLRPSVIRQTPNKTTKDEINPLFQQVVDSVELVHGSDILADFWKNGKLVKTGNSNYNLNIPTVYQSVPREFLLKTSANSTVWAFALEKGLTPNREWLIYVQSPEENLTDIVLTVPAIGDVLVNSSQNGNFYTFSESSQQTIALFSAKTNQQLDSNTTNLDDYISPYLEPVTLPSCDATNSEVQFIKTMSDWSHINDTDKSIFCVSPGDYSEKTITLTTSGTKDKKRYIVLNNGNDIHPGKLEKNNLAKVGFILKDTNYWVIDRMSYWDSYNTISPLKIVNSDYNIINRHFLDNVGKGIYLYPGSDNNTIQQCRIQIDDISLHYDRAAIGLYNNALSNISITNTKIIDNEIKNFVDGFQAIRNPESRTNLNYEGTIIDANKIFITSEIYTNCSGLHDENGSCAYAENALDFKAASNNPNNPVIVSNNHFWGFRHSDQTNSDLGDSGVAIVMHFGVNNIQIFSNVIFNSNWAIVAGSVRDGNYSLNNAKIYKNIFTDIKSITVRLDDTNDVLFTSNIFENMNKLDIPGGTHWGLFGKNQNLSITKNTFYQLDDRTAWFKYPETVFFNSNKFYNTLAGNIVDTNQTLLQKDDIHLENHEIHYDQYTKYPSNIKIQISSSN